MRSPTGTNSLKKLADHQQEMNSVDYEIACLKQTQNVLRIHHSRGRLDL